MSIFKMPSRPLHEWGPFLWGLIHTISIIDFDEPSTQRKHVDKAIDILRNMYLVIPCHKCASHYKEFFGEHLSDNEKLSKTNIYDNMELFRVTVIFHNTINEKLGKKVMTYEDAVRQWVKVI